MVQSNEPNIKNAAENAGEGVSADTNEAFEGPPPNPDLAAGTGESFLVSLDGYEGPLDVLLTLSRQQKLDLTGISILDLAEQYLTFIAEARLLRLEVAADYLVMAAWLAYLKSRLLLPPQPGDEEPTGEELAARLQHQLQRLEAMREAADTLMQRERLGVDIFPRGAPEGITVIRKSHYDCSVYDLLMAYVGQVDRSVVTSITPRPPAILSIEEAVRRLSLFLGNMPDWASLEAFLPADLKVGMELRSALASTFTASLELAKQGRLNLRQGQTFGPIYIKEAEGR
ncbi:MAG: segregation/condensation protein A [Rhodospirillaceae bacterium]|jgi:segregation and condensation protein A|nr:segregation/condensation protein A [Rhodospirillaceae bacterium]MBT3490803.1 segregation/condensation protein A [Rhodospirillaceae bacterium]MBT3782989.1 segregation/condensation protein A [Rhodospirillaceae bacterium]MBT3976407.1 segregation/condensation protein A [Rhodospirillaceae bacterium]MBT4168295.1 segregation/condensation protein A [Rhodospirillaceae bacterium]